MPSNETAVLAGGCFWCLEAVYNELRGVQHVISGYAGGSVQFPSYEQVCGGRTGHAEAVQISFDPEVISFRELLEVFFTIHDPTTLNRQGADTGTQYRSAIFPNSPEQRATAEALIAELTQAKVFDRPIVTSIEPEAPFCEAEAYHQGYYREHPSQPYCAAVISPKVSKLRAKFRDRLKPEEDAAKR